MVVKVENAETGENRQVKKYIRKKDKDRKKSKNASENYKRR